jgi:putative glutamine transport system substrate-binding protein
VDADIKTENLLRDRAVSMQFMLAELNEASNALNIVILYACRDNPFSWGRSASRGLNVVGSQPADSIVVYATSAGTTAADGTGRNGWFTTHLLNNLKKPGLEISEVFRLTGADVSRASNRQQTPAIYSQFFGTAYLAGAVPQPAPAPRPVPAVTPPQVPQNVQAIQAHGVLRVGVKSDVPGFGFLNPSRGIYEGMEIELSKLIAKEIFGDPSKIAFTPVTANTRGPLLDNGDIDLIIATFTATEERRQIYNFSSIYYIDGLGLLTKKATGYTGLKDLNGKTLGVARSANSRKVMEDAAAAIGIKVNFAEFATYPEIKAALDSGRVDAFSGDKSILRAYLDNAAKLLDDTYAPMPYGVSTKFSNKDLAAWVDGLIQKWLADGTIADLIKQFNL